MEDQLAYQNEGDKAVPGRFRSLWIDTTGTTGYPPMPDGATADVAIIGGGIVGITTALLLKEAGLKVAIVEAGRIVQDVSGHTTAKVTSLHGLIYDHMISAHGMNAARTYADASQSAIDRVESIVQKFNIDCDFVRTPAYTFAESTDDIDAVRREVDAAIRLGLPATFETEIPIPVESYGAVKFANQARFHPRKYLLALADRIPGDGSAIYENTKAESFDEGEPCVVKTNRGEIRARDVVMATHVPFFKEPGFFFSRLYQMRAYVFGVHIDGKPPEGMFFGTQNHTLRPQPTDNGTILLVGGEDHKAGQGGDIIARYNRLISFYRGRFRVTTVNYRWSTQDPDTPDRVPFIGRVSPNSRHVYVATGFQGWGMTNGTLSGMLISDAILGRVNPWADLYNPTRVNIADSASRFLSENVNMAQRFIADRLHSMEDINPAALALGEGRLGRYQGQLAGVFKDYEGRVYGVLPRCTFDECQLHWNNAEKTWDCPCCGSRFRYDGTQLHGPAKMDLKKLEI